MAAVDFFGAVGHAAGGMQAELTVEVVVGADFIAVRHAVDGSGDVLAVRNQDNRTLIPRPFTAVDFQQLLGSFLGCTW